MNKNKVGSFVLHKIMKYSSGNNIGALANLRHGFGKPCDNAPIQVIIECFVGMDDSMFGTHGTSKEQYAVYTALTAFAAHQQGLDIKSNLMHENGISFGRAISMLIDGGEDSNSMMTKSKMLYRLSSSLNMKEFSERLKPFIQLFRQKNIKLDYYAFANDIYFFQFKKNRKNVELKWASDLARGMYEKNSKDNSVECA